MIVKSTLFLFLLNLMFFNQALLASEKKCSNAPGVMQVQFYDAINCTIDNPGDIDVYAIELNQGDNIHASVYTTDRDKCKNLQPYIIGLNSDNKTLASSGSGICSGTRINFIAAETGTYTFTVNDSSGSSIGNYKIEFQCASGSCVNKSLLSKEKVEKV
ncbi:MAG: hypothetical protein KAH20_16535, partial [Methylococcales bacterium]|nr:hypothetical protein [Methylococcales bacterium]